jgi:hypothetical protein
MTQHPDQALSPAEAVVQAINRNTRAILATARLLSERLPLPGPQLPSVVTQEQSEAAYRARIGVYVEEESTRPATDRDLIEAALASARARQ